jgi:hypothetical protein
MDLAIVAGAFGLSVAVYAALGPKPEQMAGRLFLGVGGLAIFTAAVFAV